jgi:transposase
MKKLDRTERFIRLRAQGVPYREIEKELGVTKKTLIKWDRELREDIKKERAAEIEHIRSVYWGEKRGRIDLLRERLKRFHEEERKRDLSDIETAKLMALEFQTSEQLKKEIRGLPIQFLHGALSDSAPACETTDDAMTSSEGLDDGQAAAGPLATIARGDIRDLVDAILAEQAGLKGALYEIANDAASESVQVAAIKAIEAISGRMLTLVQSTGVLATLSDERQIEKVLEEWAARDSRELKYECIQEDVGAHHLLIKVANAIRSGDLEAAERLNSELNERKHQYARERMHDDIEQLSSPSTETGSNGHKAKRRVRTSGILHSYSSS